MDKLLPCGVLFHARASQTNGFAFHRKVFAVWAQVSPEKTGNAPAPDKFRIATGLFQAGFIIAEGVQDTFAVAPVLLDLHPKL